MTFYWKVCSLLLIELFTDALGCSSNAFRDPLCTNCDSIGPAWPLLTKLTVLERRWTTASSSLHNLTQFEIDHMPAYEQVADAFNKKRNFWSFTCPIDGRISQLYSCDFYGQSRHFFRVKNSSRCYPSRTDLLEDMKHTLRPVDRTLLIDFVAHRLR